jgi:Cu-processing system permease protein
LFIGLFFLISSEAMFRFGSDPSKAIVSLMNIVLIVIPLMSLILGIIHFYNSREFIELLLAQPITRSSIYLGKLIGLAVALTLVFAVGTGIPFLFHGLQFTEYVQEFLSLILVGGAFVFIFVTVAFLIATIHEDKLKGFGSTIILWLYISVIYDACILLAIYLFRDYPLEEALIALAVLNPVDLGRILILLRLDISAMMGYTGAVFQKFFGTHLGIGVSVLTLCLWLLAPLFLGLARFKRKDF